MWTKEKTIKSNATKEQIWKLWTDVPNWNTWDNQVIESRLDGEFRNDQTGQLTPNGGPKSNFKLRDVIEHKSFTSRSNLPMTTMDFIHTMEEVNGELIIKHQLQMTGVLTFMFSRLIGNKIIKELPQALSALSKQAQNL